MTKSAPLVVKIGGPAYRIGMGGGAAPQHEQQRRQSRQHHGGKQHPTSIHLTLARRLVSGWMGQGHHEAGMEGLLALAGNQLASSRFINT